MEEEDNRIHKKYFLADTFINKFCVKDQRGEKQRISEILGIDSTRLRNLFTPGYLLSYRIADKYAVKMGYHPANIWPDWFELEPEEGSNPRMKERQPSRGPRRNARKDTTQP